MRPDVFRNRVAFVQPVHTLIVPKVRTPFAVSGQKMAGWWAKSGDELREMCSVLQIAFVVTRCEESFVSLEEVPCLDFSHSAF